MMAAHIFKKPATFIKYLISRKREFLQHRTVYYKRKCSAVRPRQSVLAVRSDAGIENKPRHVLYQSKCKFASSSKQNAELSNDKELSSQNRTHDNLSRQILQCGSSKNLLDTVASNSELTPDQIVVVVNCLQKLCYAEFRKELPWVFPWDMKAYVQLLLCYDLKGRMLPLQSHQGSSALLKNMEKQSANMTTEQLATCLHNMCLLSFAGDSPPYVIFENDLRERIDTINLREARLASFVARTKINRMSQIERNSMRRADWDKSMGSALLNRLSTLIENNPMQCSKDVGDVIMALLSLFTVTNIPLWRGTVQSVLKMVLNVSIKDMKFDQIKKDRSRIQSHCIRS